MDFNVCVCVLVWISVFVFVFRCEFRAMFMFRPWVSVWVCVSGVGFDLLVCVSGWVVSFDLSVFASEMGWFLPIALLVFFFFFFYFPGYSALFFCSTSLVLPWL